MKIKPLIMAIGVSSIALYGCGGESDGGSEPNQDIHYSVTALDGYLQKATVWLDLNKNYQLDDNEPRATTGEGGKAELLVQDISGNPEDYPLVVKAIAGVTIDEDNPDVPIPDGFILSAPSGKDVVSPLTTLVDIKMRRDNISEDDATEAVAELVGIDKELILSDFAQDKESDAAKIAQQTAKSLVSAGAVPKDEDELKQDAEGSSPDDIEDAAEAIGTVLVQDRENSGEDYDYSKIVNKDGAVDTDTDKDGVPDADDAFDDDPEESKDSDGDKVGDNADVFDDDPTEWADKDGDKVGDNADLFDDDPTEWADKDGDKVGDNADLFDDDPTEWADKDGDEVGDNADVFDDDPTEWADKDGDKVGDNADVFDDDPTEWADKDGDKVGDNADVFDDDPTEWADKDGDKVGDNADLFDDDPTEWADDDNDGIGNNKDPDSIPVSGITAADFLSENNKFAVFEFDFDELYYENISWSSIDYTTTLDEYFYDSELNTFIAEDDDEGDRGYTLTVNGEWILVTDDEAFKIIPQEDGSIVDQNSSTGEEQTASGQELLLDGRNIQQVLKAKANAGDTVLKIPSDTVFSARATALELTWNSQNNRYELFNWDCHDDSLPATQTGFTNCNTVYQFRGFNPDGSYYDGPAETLASLIVESAGETGTSMDFLGFSALMESVSTQLYANNTGAFYHLSWEEPYDYHRLSTNLSWTQETVHEQTLYVLQTTEPEYAEYINNAFFVELEGYVRMGRKINDDEERETVLLFNEIAEQDILNAIGAIELPETLTATCGDAYDYPASSTPLTTVPQAYLDAIDACNSRPLQASSFNNGSRFVRLNSSGESRGYEFHDNGTWTYYKRGLKQGTQSYMIDPANPRLLLWRNDKEFAAYAVTDYAADGARNVLILDQFPGEKDDPDYPDPNLYYVEHWPSIMYSYGKDWMDLCEKLDSGWDDTTDQPKVLHSKAEFEQVLEECQSWWGERRPKFTLAMLAGRKLVFDTEDYIQFPTEANLPVTYSEETRLFSLDWSIDENGHLQLSYSDPSFQASETWVILDTDGVQFSAKMFHQNSDFSDMTGEQGEIWSTMFHLE